MSILKIFYYNANGINKRIFELKCFLNNLTNFGINRFTWWYYYPYKIASQALCPWKRLPQFPARNKVQLSGFSPSSTKVNLRFRVKNAARIITKLDPRETCSQNKITGKNDQRTPSPCYTAVTRISYFPGMWRTFVIITVEKPRKALAQVASYRLISLFPTLSKVFKSFRHQSFSRS